MAEKVEKGRDKTQGDANSSHTKLFDELVRTVKRYLALQTGESEASCRVNGDHFSLSVSLCLPSLPVSALLAF